MSITNAQQTVAELFKNITHPRLGSFIALTEEVGELANEVMKKEIYAETSDDEAISSELTDVFVCLLELANLYGVDLQSAFDDKITSLTPRVKEWQSIKDVLKAKREKLDKHILEVIDFKQYTLVTNIINYYTTMKLISTTILTLAATTAMCFAVPTHDK